jgi:aryl-alcohol dehydrogenase-like predicted oxidoreductase
MRYNQFGRTGLIVSELCLGTMTFGGVGMFSAVGSLQQEDADAILKAAIDGGVNFIDTADIYSLGKSEEITGQAIRNLGLKRDELVIATKFLGVMGDSPNSRGASRYHIMNAVEASLKRLSTDHIDLYQIHGWDPLTPIEETLRTLDDLVRRGLVRYIGLSNWAAWQIMKALGISDRQGLARFESIQAYYSIAGRDLEREIVPLMQSEGLGLMVWSPLAGGFLSGKYTRDGDGEGRRANFNFPPIDREQAFDIIDVMRRIAEAKGVSVAQVALAWLLHQRSVTTVIVGANRTDQLADNLKAVNVALSPEELTELDKISMLTPEYPGWMIARQAEYRDIAGNHAPRGAR